MIRVAAVVTTVLLTLVVAVASLPLVATGRPPPTPGEASLVTAGIPPRIAGVYHAATQGRCPRLDWTLLAAVGQVESGHAAGRRIAEDGTVAPPVVGPPLDGSAGVRRIVDTDGGDLDGDEVWDRAVGPMQFVPGTWRRVGVDASGDGLADPHNIEDAVHAAAAHLCELTAEASVERALRAYNDSGQYVERVLAMQRAYRGLYAAADITEPGGSLLTHPNLLLTPQAAEDLRAGRVDQRVATLLSAMASQTEIGVSVITSGHDRHVAGTSRISNHACGRAVDIWQVGGEPVDRRNGVARQIVEWAAGIQGALRPSEIGQPWGELTGLTGVFADNAHADHLHLGFGTPDCS